MVLLVVDSCEMEDMQNVSHLKKIFFVTNFLQMILLFFSILSITQANRFTSGLLFSTVTYVGMLNGYVGDINEYLILLQDLKETVYRLKGENNNELQR